MKHKLFRGDTLIEVMFAVGIFGMVAVGAIGVMNRGLVQAQNSLEITMARTAIDSQAEALRFIHAAYLAEKKVTDPTAKKYTSLWQAITGAAYPWSGVGAIPAGFYSAATYNNIGDSGSCPDIYNHKDDNEALVAKSFVINPRRLDSSASASEITSAFQQYAPSGANKVLYDTATYPRLVYPTTATGETLSERDNLSNYDTRLNLSRAEGIWVTAIQSQKTVSVAGTNKPEYYDFYIRTCWDSADDTSSTISTTIRLYNPDVY